MATSAFNIFSKNNLKKIEQLIWDFFQQGVKNKKSVFHLPTIATCGDKTFNLRTVVLRKVIREEHILVFHTDIRSQKIAELKSNNNYFYTYMIKKIKYKSKQKEKQKYFMRQNLMI